MFGLAGYRDSDTTHAIVDQFDRTGMEIMDRPFSPRANSPVPNQCMARLQAQVRSIAGARDHRENGRPVPMIAYGEFERTTTDGQPNPFATPAHVWIEVNNRIYETFPNHPLQSEEATAQSRAQPASIANINQDTYALGWTTGNLTVDQARIIAEYESRASNASDGDGDS